MPSSSASESGRQRHAGAATALASPWPAAYLVVVLCAALTTFAWWIRNDSILACPASGYTAEHYLVYCQATSYGDYDHGAFWFLLEPEATRHAHDADVLFVGNSRMQFGFSTPATAAWSAATSAHYYLLGFGYWERYLFQQGLLPKIGPQARVYVVNIDSLFERQESEPARFVMHDPGARARYQDKRWSQRIHRLVCGGLPFLCGVQSAIFRSRENGSWTLSGGIFKSTPVSVDATLDPAVVASQAAIGKEFISAFPVARDCVILTMVPTVKMPIATGRAVAARLGMELVAPEVDGLVTFDGSHLDARSAERWATAFFEIAGPRMARCLAQK